MSTIKPDIVISYSSCKFHEELYAGDCHKMLTIGSDGLIRATLMDGSDCYYNHFNQWIEKSGTMPVAPQYVDELARTIIDAIASVPVVPTDIMGRDLTSYTMEVSYHGKDYKLLWSSPPLDVPANIIDLERTLDEMFDRVEPLTDVPQEMRCCK